MESREIRSLTGIRGIAALYVVIYHYSAGRYVFLQNGYLAVDLFFILSGFIMCYVYEGQFDRSASFRTIGNFWRHRFARVYPAYIFWLIAFVALRRFILHHGSVNPENFLVSTTLFQSLAFTKGYSNGSWSVTVEYALYLVVPAMFILNRSRTFIAILMLSSVGILLFLTSHPPVAVTGRSHMSGPLDLYHTATFGPLLRGFAGFSLGTVAYHLLPFLKKLDRQFLYGCQLLISLAILSILIFLKGFDFYFVSANKSTHLPVSVRVC